MPIHDWTRAAELYLHFRHMWMGGMCDALNAGGLPPGHMALIEQRPNARPVAGRLAEGDVYAGRPNRVAIHAGYGRAVAVVEIVTAGNKFDGRTLQAICDQLTATVRSGVHVLVIDLFPPAPSNPCGIHPILWEAFGIEDSFELPPEKPLTLAAYNAGSSVAAYIDPVAVGDSLPGMPIFLRPDVYVPAPLAESYERTWAGCPEAMKAIVTGRTA
jgi:hypothetical protein